MFIFTWLFSLFGPSGTQRAINEAIAESAKAEAAQAAKDKAEAEALAAKAKRVSAAAEKAEQATQAEPAKQPLDRETAINQELARIEAAQANPNRRRDRDDGR
jgi:acyl-CoA hydrolase